MDIKISPSVLSGHVDIPASKSCAHRALICASLASGTSVLTGVSMSKDIEATISSMEALGASFTVNGTTVTVTGVQKSSDKAVIDCNESGSTLRFIMPVAAALGTDAEFIGRGRLPQRPIDIYKRELAKNGIRFITSEMPYRINGKLHSGIYEIEGNVSSQFITGLLFALPLLEGDSEVRLTSHLESRPYVDITVDILRKYGIEIRESETAYFVPGGQHYVPHDEHIEGDWSQAAFFAVANTINSKVDIGNLNEKSVQGDKKILEIISDMCYNCNGACFKADCSDIPDLVPILSVLAAYGKGESVIFNAERLRIKESDRLSTTAAMLNAIGGDVSVNSDGLTIRPVSNMKGGVVDGCGDHRIVMAAAVAALGCSGDVIIKGAEAAEKSYPDFFKDYIALGGKADVIDLE